MIVTSKAEFRIEDTAAWCDALQTVTGMRPDDSQLRLSRDELTEFLSAAWHTAAEILPTLIVEYPFAIAPRYRPIIQLELSTDSQQGRGT